MPTLYRFNVEGNLIWGPDERTQITQFLLEKTEEKHPGSLAFISEKNLGIEVVPIIVDGQVESITLKNSLVIYCHLTLAGPNGDSPPTLAADGVSAVAANIKLTATDDINADALPIDKNWLILVRRTDGMGYENIPISITQGVGSTNFTTNAPTDFEVRQSDFKPQDLSAYGLGEVAIKLRIYPEQPESPDGVARMYAYRS